jgi:hydroxymethylpyrimidine pyrophosphatase-like HAD family hydrolase
MIVQEVATGAALARRDFAFADVMAAIDRLNALGLDPLVLGHNPDGKTRDVFHRLESPGLGTLMNGDFIDKNIHHAVQLDDWSRLKDKHLVEIILIGPRQPLQAAAAGLAGLGLEIVIIRNTYYKEYMLEITPRGISKLEGARELLARLGLADGDALVIGDSENDLSMIRHLPDSVAMANADPRVKAAAKEITGSNADGGVGQAVFRRLGSQGADSRQPTAGG